MVHIVPSGSTTGASVTNIPIDTNIHTIEIIFNDLAGLYISILMAQTALCCLFSFSALFIQNSYGFLVFCMFINASALLNLLSFLP